MILFENVSITIFFSLALELLKYYFAIKLDMT